MVDQFNSEVTTILPSHSVDCRVIY